MNTLEVAAISNEEIEILENELDSLKIELAKRTSSGPKRVGRFVSCITPSLLALAFLLLLWTALVHFRVRPPTVLPSPLDVWHSVRNLLHEGILWKAVENSLRRAAIGFLASIVVGTGLGILLVKFRLLRMGIGQILSGLQSLPSVAWVPAAIIWFGVGDAAIYTVVLFGAVPSIATGLMIGVRHVPPLYIRVGHVIGARGLTAFQYITMPAALPTYFAGLRQGWAFSWRSLMAAELIATAPGLGNSLGQLLQNGRRLSDMTLVLTAIILILAVGIGVESTIFGPIERKILRTRGIAGNT